MDGVQRLAIQRCHRMLTIIGLRGVFEYEEWHVVQLHVAMARGRLN